MSNLKATGWDTGLCQDYNKGLAKWLSSRLDARHIVRKYHQSQEKSMPQRRPVVKYRPSPNDVIKVGHSAFIHPINHTSPRVSNNSFVFTSMVMEVFKDGQFETMNTLYQPHLEAENG